MAYSPEANHSLSIKDQERFVHISPQESPSEEFIKRQEQIFKETSEPGDSLDLSTGKITKHKNSRRSLHLAHHHSNQNFNDMVSGIVEREIEEEQAKHEAIQKKEEQVHNRVRRLNVPSVRGGLRTVYEYAKSAMK